MVVDSFISDLGMTRTEVSFIWLVAISISAASTPFAGAFLDKHGPIRLLRLISIPYVISVFLMGLV
jgi:hypothetical protein